MDISFTFYILKNKFNPYILPYLLIQIMWNSDKNSIENLIIFLICVL